MMPNHIHFFIGVRQRIILPENSKYTDQQFISKQFSNLFSSYSQAFNKQQRRMGIPFIMDSSEISHYGSFLPCCAGGDLGQ